MMCEMDMHITPPDYPLQILGAVPFFLCIPHTRPLPTPTTHKPFFFVIHVATRAACLVFAVSLGGFIMLYSCATMR